MIPHIIIIQIEQTLSKLEIDGNFQSLIQFYHKYRTNIILNKITEVTP